MCKYIFLWCGLFVFVYSHSYHFTTMEVEWVDTSDSLEIALLVDSIELEKVLSIFSKESIDLDKTENLGDHLCNYLKKTFVVENFVDGKILSIKWLGKEILGREAWLYFEVPLNGCQEIKISNTLFFDLPTEAEKLHSQINMMNFRYKDKKKSLCFSQEKATQVLHLLSLKE